MTRYRPVTSGAKPQVSVGAGGTMEGPQLKNGPALRGQRNDSGLTTQPTAKESRFMATQEPTAPTPHPVNDWNDYAVPLRRDERGGIQCLRHVLAGWPVGRDCPCVAEAVQ